MGGVIDAIRWSGSEVRVSLFVMMESLAKPVLTMAVGEVVPERVRHYLLEDEDEVLGDRVIHEFDSSLREAPADLEAYLFGCLAEALRAGGILAWLGFEGSFDFDHLLTDDIAPSVFGVGDSVGLSVVLSEQQLNSADWLKRVRVSRGRFGEIEG